MSKASSLMLPAADVSKHSTVSSYHRKVRQIGKKDEIQQRLTELKLQEALMLDKILKQQSVEKRDVGTSPDMPNLFQKISISPTHQIAPSPQFNGNFNKDVQSRMEREMIEMERQQQNEERSDTNLLSSNTNTLNHPTLEELKDDNSDNSQSKPQSHFSYPIEEGRHIETIPEVSEDSPFRQDATISFKNDESEHSLYSPEGNGSVRKNVNFQQTTKVHHGRTNSHRLQSPNIAHVVPSEPYRAPRRMHGYNQSLSIPKVSDAYLFDSRGLRDSTTSSRFMKQSKERDSLNIARQRSSSRVSGSQYTQQTSQDAAQEMFLNCLVGENAQKLAIYKDILQDNKKIRR